MADIHPRLAEDCAVAGRFPLCHILLMKDANYPWFILVPDREGVSEIYQLSEADQLRLTRESSLFSRLLVETFKPDKLNIAALGNIVPQLHIHHIVRYRNDPAWPAPVWGRVPAKPYSDGALAEILSRIRAALAPHEAAPTRLA